MSSDRRSVPAVKMLLFVTCIVFALSAKTSSIRSGKTARLCIFVFAFFHCITFYMFLYMLLMRNKLMDNCMPLTFSALLSFLKRNSLTFPKLHLVTLTLVSVTV